MFPAESRGFSQQAVRTESSNEYLQPGLAAVRRRSRENGCKSCSRMSGTSAINRICWEFCARRSSRVISRHVPFDPDKVRIEMDRGKSISTLRRSISKFQTSIRRSGNLPYTAGRGQSAWSNAVRAPWIKGWHDAHHCISHPERRRGKNNPCSIACQVAASTGEKVIALDLDPQQSLARWGKRREAANARNKIIVEPLERERLPRLRAILDGLAGVGFTLAIFDTTGADSHGRSPGVRGRRLCLLPARPTRLDVEATAATFRAVFLAKRKAAFVLNQCPQATAARGRARRQSN